MNFSFEIVKGLVDSWPNDYSDNWDSVRYGPEPKRTGTWKKVLKERLGRWHVIRSNDLKYLMAKCERDGIYFEHLFCLLKDSVSKSLLVKIFLYRLLGHRKIRLPLSTVSYWDAYRKIEKLTDKSDCIETDFMDFKLYKYNLHELGYPIELFFNPMGILTDFSVKQYEFLREGETIKAEEGDIVIDGGGCWGDTALYFANEVGPGGRVYTFEFIPSNQEILQRNLSLNPNLKAGIELVPNPLWETSNLEVFMLDKGPASRVKLQAFEGQTGQVATVALDDWVSDQNLTTVDFIKLDIEGAELMALKGAEKSIRKFQPKLAIALYHSNADFDEIPKYLESLHCGYEFFLSHCTIHQEETVLFAKPRKR